MRLNREELLQQLESVQPGLSTRDVIEQSSCFVFKDGYIVTYNDEIACRHATPLKIVGAVPAEPLLAILRKLPEDEVEVDVEEGAMVVRGKGRKAVLRMEADILLPMGKLEPPNEWVRLHEEFSEALEIVQYSAGTNESEFTLTCIHIHPKWVEACDNAQMTRYRLKTKVSEPILLKRDSVKHIATLGMVEFSETAGWMHFRNPSELIVSCRRYVEEYPDISHILEGTGEPATLPKGLADAADRAAVFSSENDDDQVLVQLRPSKLRIKSTGTTGKYQETKRLNYNGPEMEFQISPKLLVEIMKRHNGDCQISPEKLMVDGGKFTYVTALGIDEDEQPSEDD